jgi:hypothetical protein
MFNRKRESIEDELLFNQILSLVDQIQIPKVNVDSVKLLLEKLTNVVSTENTALESFRVIPLIHLSVHRRLCRNIQRAISECKNGDVSGICNITPVLFNSELPKSDRDNDLQARNLWNTFEQLALHAATYELISRNLLVGNLRVATTVYKLGLLLVLYVEFAEDIPKNKAPIAEMRYEWNFQADWELIKLHEPEIRKPREFSNAAQRKKYLDTKRNIL